MNKYLFITLLMCLFFGLPNTFAQETEKYAKVKINLTNKNIRELSNLGIETDHGIIVPYRYIINDYSMSEINLIKNAGFEIDILIEDVITYYKNPNRPSALSETASKNNFCEPPSTKSFSFNEPKNYKAGTMGGYHKYQEMKDILDEMRAKFPDLISTDYSIDSIPTHKGNYLFYVRVSNEPYLYNTNKPQILYTALHHAREPNSLSQMLYYMWFLLENYGTDPMVTKLLNETQMVFVPCINPDGYMLNETQNPSGGGMWRKNVWKNNQGTLMGVDLNRNYEYSWGYDDSGSSSAENSQVFRGPSAFSEPETRAVKALCETFDFVVALNYHSFGNIMIHPWGYNNTLSQEDNIFKNFGKSMTRYNNFSLGTVAQTLGYFANGNSDDWMYGEAVTKNPVYAYTPEVGYSFWPSPDDIVVINRSSLWTNLNAALVTGNFYTADIINSSKYVLGTKSYIDVKITKSGLKNGSSKVTLHTDTDGVIVKTPAETVNLAINEEKLLQFEFEVDISKNYPEGIRFNLIIDQDGYQDTTTFRRTWVKGTQIQYYYDRIDNDENWIRSGFDLNTNHYNSAPSCFKESADFSTPLNYESFVQIKKPFDLSDTKLALLRFFTRWDIEKQFDYAVVEVSEDSINFSPLCGLYTKPGSDNQLKDEPVYDGTQTEWIREEMDLSSYIGQKKIWIRFRMFSDAFVSGEGFWVDDIEIIKITETVKTQETQNFSAELFPTVSDGSGPLTIKGKTDYQNISCQFINVYGEVVMDIQTRDHIIDIQKYNLPSGLYYYVLRNPENGTMTSGKTVIMR
ncbi:MAG: immune inhibitor A [Saprospiraceae bacterium]|nr:immune inhibitor A [Saprospiraceae bacterium]